MKNPLAILFSLFLLVAFPIQAAAEVKLTEREREELLQLAPDVEITEELVEKLRAVIYDRSLSVEERIRAVQRITDFNPQEPVERTVCVWDIAGRSGPIFQAARDQQSELLEYGADVTMEAYTNEGVMVEDLQSGRCDAALMTGLRARIFNKYAGTIDAVGAVPDEQHMRTLMRVVTDPRQRKLMEDGNYVVMGVAPAGAAYIFVNDKEINSLARAAGKRVAVLDYDETQAEMVAQIGATPVPSDISSAPNRFNNNVVDVLAAPLAAYEVMELYRGMTPDGGIIDYPLAQITMQLIGRKESFPTEIAQLVRESFYENYEEIRQQVKREEERVPDRWWVEIPEEDQQEYEVMMQDARIQLREDGYYHPEMLRLQRRIRCQINPDRYECTDPKE